MQLARGRAKTALRALVVAVALVAGGCDDGPVQVREEFQPVGVWGATTFTANIEGTSYNILQEGGSISVTLHADGRTSGLYVFPSLDEVPGDEVPLTGDWQRTAPTSNTITFDHEGYSYMRYLFFQGGGDQMVGEGVVDGAQVRIILSRF